MGSSFDCRGLHHVTVVDFDYHCGNGILSLVRDGSSALSFASIHAGVHSLWEYSLRTLVCGVFLLVLLFLCHTVAWHGSTYGCTIGTGVCRYSAALAHPLWCPCSTVCLQTQ